MKGISQTLNWFHFALECQLRIWEVEVRRKERTVVGSWTPNWDVQVTTLGLMCANLSLVSAVLPVLFVGRYLCWHHFSTLMVVSVQRIWRGVSSNLSRLLGGDRSASRLVGSRTTVVFRPLLTTMQANGRSNGVGGIRALFSQLPTTTNHIVAILSYKIAGVCSRNVGIMVEGIARWPTKVATMPIDLVLLLNEDS